MVKEKEFAISPTTVLMMSRDTVCINFLKNHLDAGEFEILEVSSDSDVIQKNNEEYPDILLLDFEAVQMPPDILVSVLHKINPHLQVILVAGVSSLEDAKAIEQGVFYYTSKPIGTEVIEALKAGRKISVYGT